MGELTLMSRPPLDGYTGESDGLRLAERSGMAVVSVAVPAHARDEFAVNLRDAWGIDAPPVGRSVVSESGPRLIGLQAAQWFVLMEDAGDRAEKLVAEALGTDVHLTDQSDGWAALEVTGSRCRDVLSRLCMLDLHPDAFPVHAATRTVMEHLAVIVLRNDDERFLLLSPRSSALSFLETVEAAYQQTDF